MELILGLGQFVIDNAPALAGLLLPPVVQILNREVPNEEERHVVSILVCFAFAVLIHADSLKRGSVSEAAAGFGIIYFECNTMWNLYFKRSWIRYTIQDQVEKGTI